MLTCVHTHQVLVGIDRLSISDVTGAPLTAVIRRSAHSVTVSARQVGTGHLRTYDVVVIIAASLHVSVSNIHGITSRSSKCVVHTYRYMYMYVNIHVEQYQKWQPERAIIKSFVPLLGIDCAPRTPLTAHAHTAHFW